MVEELKINMIRVETFPKEKVFLEMKGVKYGFYEIELKKEHLKAIFEKL